MVDFKKHSLMKDLLEKGPVDLYVIVGRHPESDAYWIECSFFYNADAKKAMDWLCENKPIDSGVGHYEITKTTIRKWKGDD